MTQGHRSFVDWLVWISTGIAALGVNQILTAIAILVSIVLGCIRVYDRIKYGPNRSRND